MPPFLRGAYRTRHISVPRSIYCHMIHKKYFFVFCLCAFLFCLSVCSAVRARVGDQDANIAILTVSEDGDGRYIALWDLPQGTARVAVLFDLRLGEGGFIPHLALTEDTVGCTLTLSQPSDDRVRVLVDGEISVDASGDIRLLQMGATGSDECRLSAVRDGLWLVGEEGRGYAYPLFVVGDEEGHDSSPPIASDAEMVSQTCPWTQNEIDSEKQNEMGSETICGSTRLPDFLECGEVLVGDVDFSVKLLFWQGEGCRAPATVCMGGGQAVTLTAVRVGNTSAVTYTYRGLQKEGECRIYIYTEDGVVEILFEDGAVITKRTASLSFLCLMCRIR